MFYFTSVAVATFDLGMTADARGSTQKPRADGEALGGQKCMEMKVHLPKSCVHVCPMAQTSEALVAATVDSPWVRESIGGAVTCHPEPFQCSIRIWVGGKLPRAPGCV